MFNLVFDYISEDEEEDFSKGAESFVEAAKQRRAARQSENGNNLSKSWNCVKLFSL